MHSSWHQCNMMVKFPESAIIICDFLCDQESIRSHTRDSSGYALNPLQWRHNERDSVSNHQLHDCLSNCLFRQRSKKTSKLRVTGLCVTGDRWIPAQMTSNAKNVSIWWRHHAMRNDVTYMHYFSKTNQSTARKPTDFRRISWIICLIAVKR